MKKSKVLFLCLVLGVLVASTGCLLNLNKSFDLKATVLNVNNTPIANAQVTVKATTNQTGITDKNGIANFTKLSGQVTVSATAEGFETQSQVLKMDANKNITLKLVAKELSYDLNVTVLKDADNTPIVNAKVSINSTTINTNTNGIASFTKLIGQVTVSVTADGFEAKSQTLTIDANKDLTIKLMAKGLETVGSAIELEKAINNSSVTSIKLANNISANCTLTRLVNLDLSSYTLTGSLTYNTSESGTLTLAGLGSLKGDLTVIAPNTTVINQLKVDGKVNIEAVASDSWFEEAENNSLVITTTGANIHIVGGANEVIINAAKNSLYIEGTVLNLLANYSVTVTGANNIESALINAEKVIFDVPPTNIDDESSYIAIVRRLFEPGSGGSIALINFASAPPRTISGLYLRSTQRTHFSFSLRNELELSFVIPAKYEATSYILQYSKDGGNNWLDYLIDDSPLETVNEYQDLFVIYPDGEYLYRLRVNGGNFNGYTSNVVKGPLSAVDSAFNSWYMDESMWISGVMLPFVGRGIEFDASAIKLDKDATDVSETLSYSWWRIDPFTYEMTEIIGQTSQTYITNDDDIGYFIGCRATGNSFDSGGYLQVVSNSRVVVPNKAFISDVTENGFNLNLYKSVSNLSKEQLELTWMSRDLFGELEITAVTDLGTGSVYHISAQIPPEAETLYLSSLDSYWVIVAASHGHLSTLVWYDM